MIPASRRIGRKNIIASIRTTIIIQDVFNV